LKLDTTVYNDGIRELKIVAFDKEGNRSEKRVNFVINNGILIWNFWVPWIVLFVIIAVTGFFSYLISKKWAKVWVNKIRSNYAEKLRLKEIDKDQVIKRVEELEPELSKNPLTLHCKFCKSWFSSNEFHIVCPICGRDKVYATYNCLNCGKWVFKDEPSENYYCDKCETVKLVKRNREEIKNILNEEGTILREYERKKSEFSILDL
jgi:Zn finger protein HypA/HybF involved in hydrogenase expression